MTNQHTKILCGAVAAVACAFTALAQGSGATLSEAQLTEEMYYINFLQNELRMPDIAGEVIADLKAKYPGDEALTVKIKVAEMQGLLSQGKFDEVQKVIDAIKDKKSVEYWALVLAKADSYYAFGRYDESSQLYQKFFTAFPTPPAALTTFFRDSAYRYAQMLILRGKKKEALKTYQLLSKIKLDENAQRAVWSDIAELNLQLAPLEKDPKVKSAMMKEADALASKLLWNQDVFFGKAIVFKAHCLLMQGKVAAAQQMVEDYMPQLKTIHDALREMDPDGTHGELRMSPMPQCRYMLATLLWNSVKEEMKKEKPDKDKITDLLLGERDATTRKRKGNGAYNHFLNVFLRFPESQWAVDCGNKTEEIAKFIKEQYGKSIRNNVTPEQIAKVRKMQFGNAQTVFRSGQYKNAIEELRVVLNKFPEVPEAVPALADLAFCYLDAPSDVADPLMAEMVTGYLAERFCENSSLMKDAGDQLRRIAEHYGEMGDKLKRAEVYQIFLRNYPAHYAAGSTAWNFAETDFAASNYTAALSFYQTITEVYTNSTYYLPSINRIAQIYGEMGDVTNELSWLNTYVEKLKASDLPGHALVAGSFRLAEAQRQFGVMQKKELESGEGLSDEEKAALQKAYLTSLVKAAMGFNNVVKMLETPEKYQQNDKEKQSNAELKENATFLSAISRMLMSHPNADMQKKLRQGAIDAFEAYMKAYPQGKYASRVQMQIGTLHTVNQDVENAQKAFDKLARDYPNSDEAKNSVPMQAEALMEMGLKGEAVVKYRQMFAAGGNYSEGQFLKAGDALRGAREYDAANQAYDKVLAKTKEIALRARALIGKIECQIGLKKYADAHKSIDTFLKDKELGRTRQFIDANRLLVDVASEEGRVERNDQERVRLFNIAVKALQTVRAYGTPRGEDGKPKAVSEWSDAERRADAELKLKSSEVVLDQLAAEKKLGLDDKVEETRGRAIVAFEGMLMSMKKNDPAIAPVLEKVYYDCIPLVLEHKQNADAAEYCKEYLNLFPNGKYVTEVKTWLSQAQ